MSNYTFLVINEEMPGGGALRGQIYSVQEGEGVWGKKEVLPQFAKISFEGAREEMNWVYRKGGWNGSNYN